MKNIKQSNCSKITPIVHVLSILAMLITLKLGSICKSLTPIYLLIGATIFYISLMVFVFTIFKLTLNKSTQNHITSKKILEHFDKF